MEHLSILKKPFKPKKVVLTEKALRKHIVCIETKSRRDNEPVESNFKLKRLYIYLKQHHRFMYEESKSNSPDYLDTNTDFEESDAVNGTKNNLETRVSHTKNNNSINNSIETKELQRNKNALQTNPVSKKISGNKVQNIFTSRLTISANINKSTGNKLGRLGVFNKSKISKLDLNIIDGVGSDVFQPLDNEQVSRFDSSANSNLKSSDLSNNKEGGNEIRNENAFLAEKSFLKKRFVNYSPEHKKIKFHKNVISQANTVSRPKEVEDQNIYTDPANLDDRFIDMMHNESPYPIVYKSSDIRNNIHQASNFDIPIHNLTLENLDTKNQKNDITHNPNVENDYQNAYDTFFYNRCFENDDIAQGLKMDNSHCYVFDKVNSYKQSFEKYYIARENTATFWKPRRMD
ncbi:hypothetical protein BB560_003070 [Smittium megazygosporum]|uniref:Uncharacterized protein n=1 Tax=Smittium megazygosporum TaxID=133381 RepID=A0A2T9ZD00_9FUNG|nr:hypothetical protein BB560_003070 [Smittium megazygosporum]